MEKLLLQTQNKGGKTGNSIRGQRTINIFFSGEATKIFNANTQATTFLLNLYQDELS